MVISIPSFPHLCLLRTFILINHIILLLHLRLRMISPPWIIDDKGGEVKEVVIKMKKCELGRIMVMDEIAFAY